MVQGHLPVRWISGNDLAAQFVHLDVLCGELLCGRIILGGLPARMAPSQHNNTQQKRREQPSNHSLSLQPLMAPRPSARRLDQAQATGPLMAQPRPSGV